MKLTSFLLVGMAMVSAEFYSSRYDDFDVKPLVENDRILQSYTNCFLDKGPCTPDAKEFKSRLFTLYSKSILFNLVIFIIAK